MKLQSYEAPRADAFTVSQEASILSSSVVTTVSPYGEGGFQFGRQTGGGWD